MNKIISTVAVVSAMTFSTVGLAADADAVQAEIKEYEKAKADAQAEIAQLKVKLEKATNQVNQHETKVQEIQAKLDAKQ